MSTKCSLAHNSEYHLYYEAFSNDLFLEVSNHEATMHCDLDYQWVVTEIPRQAIQDIIDGLEKYLTRFGEEE